jgi:hypothetical protein
VRFGALYRPPLQEPQGACSRRARRNPVRSACKLNNLQRTKVSRRGHKMGSQRRTARRVVRSLGKCQRRRDTWDHPIRSVPVSVLDNDRIARGHLTGAVRPREPEPPGASSGQTESSRSMAKKSRADAHTMTSSPPSLRRFVRRALVDATGTVSGDRLQLAAAFDGLCERLHRQLLPLFARLPRLTDRGLQLLLPPAAHGPAGGSALRPALCHL